MKTKLLRTAIDAAPYTERGQYYLWDTEYKGFGVRIGKDTKTFILKTQMNGNTLWLTVGKYPVMTPEQARKTVLSWMGQIAKGVHPTEPSEEEAISNITVGESMERYLEIRDSHLKDSTKHSIRYYMNHYLPDWAILPVKDITPNMVEKKHREIGQVTQRGANLTMRYLRAILNTAITLHTRPDGTSLLPPNPCTRLTALRAWYPEKARERTIPPDKIKVVFDRLMENRRVNPGQSATSDMLLFLLFTGCRKSEATGLLWDNVRFGDKTVTFMNTKNHRNHTIPMSDFIYELLVSIKTESKNLSLSGYVFPGTGKTGHVSDSRRQLSVLSALAGSTFSHHDLRRVFITVGKSVVEGDYVSFLVNHTIQTVTGRHYFVPDIDQLRDPMQRITDRILFLAGVKK